MDILIKILLTITVVIVSSQQISVVAGSDDIDSLLDDAEFNLKLERPDEANLLFDKALNLDPQNTQALIGKGKALFELQRHQESEVFFDRVLEIEPMNIDALTYKGKIRFNEGSYDLAISFFNQAIKTDLNNLGTLNDIGDSYKMLGDNKSALFYFEKILNLESEYKDIEFRPIYDKVLELNPSHLNALILKGNVLLEEGKIKEGMKIFEKILSVEPSNVEGLAGKGRSLIKLGEIEKGMVLLEKTLQNDPQNINALSGMGMAMLELKMPHKAVSYFDKALKIDSSHLESREGFSLAAKKAGLFIASTKINHGHQKYFKPEFGFVELVVRDKDGNLITYQRKNSFSILDDPIASERIENWDLVKEVIKDGKKYKILHHEETRTISKKEPVGHPGIVYPFSLERIWLTFSQFELYEVYPGDVVTTGFTLYQPGG